jgi:hypothetical protein
MSGNFGHVLPRQTGRASNAPGTVADTCPTGTDTVVATRLGHRQARARHFCEDSRESWNQEFRNPSRSTTEAPQRRDRCRRDEAIRALPGPRATTKDALMACSLTRDKCPCAVLSPYRGNRRHWKCACGKHIHMHSSRAGGIRDALDICGSPAWQGGN